MQLSAAPRTVQNVASGHECPLEAFATKTKANTSDKNNQLHHSMNHTRAKQTRPRNPKPLKEGAQMMHVVANANWKSIKRCCSHESS